MTMPVPPFAQIRRPKTPGILFPAILTGILLLSLPCALTVPKLLIWNASASVPVGLYRVRPGHDLQTGELAVTDLPADVRSLADARRYLPLGVLLIKPVAATAGTVVCRKGADISVDDRTLGQARAGDRTGRPMPVWQGCRTVGVSEIFLMNPAVPDSFDGRYFGPIPQTLVRGRAIPLLIFRRQSPGL